jgi:phosphatidylglycerol---prolipoprotein diacylglyceryl transferase
MLPVLFKFGALELRSYGFFVALGFAAGILITLFYAGKEKLSRPMVLDLSICTIISAIAGARLFYVIGEWGYYRANPLEIVMVQNGGLVYLGGLLLSIAVVYFYGRAKGINLLKLFDAATPGTVIGYAIGRIGCFLNGCCFGLPTKMPWGIIFPKGSLAEAYCGDIPLHPTQLYSSLSMLLAFLVLIWIYRQKKFDGQIIFLGLIFYSLYRFIVEFFRFSPIHWLSLTPSQWVVIPLFVFGVWGLVYFSKRKVISSKD